MSPEIRVRTLNVSPERIAVFWTKVAKGDGCWEWTGKHTGKGYGLFWNGKVSAPAHRYAWIIANGPPPDGMFVCHRCDNPKCVRVDHLFLGTNADNIADRTAKGRQAKGERSGGARLNPDLVRAIRARSKVDTYAVLAEKFGVSRNAVKYVVTGMSWDHVDRETLCFAHECVTVIGQDEKLCDEHQREVGLTTLRARLREVEAERDTAKRNYFALADAVCRESTSVEDACHQARETRAERDGAVELVRDAVKYVVEDRAVTPRATRLERWVERACAYLADHDTRPTKGGE